jgi:dihydroorotate dehydrogenase (fumarate)
LEKYGFSSIEEVKSSGLKKQVSYDAFLPELVVEKCTRCLLCERICPYFAIEMKDKITFNPDKCFSCGLCIAKCPTKAIKKPDSR